MTDANGNMNTPGGNAADDAAVPGTAHPYEALKPDVVLAAVDSTGLLTDGRLLALNSYENRVYQVGIEDATPVVVKFYRPERWSDAQILEEHAFAIELAGLEIPVIAPLAFNDRTLLEHDGFRFAVFPRRGGHPPELENPEHLEMLGRFLGRIHAAGRAKRFEHRDRLTPQSGHDSIDFVLQHTVPDYLQDSFRATATELMQEVDNAFDAHGPMNTLRLHGDCHPGNILWTDHGPHFVDLDDCITGPAIQDIWMLLSGTLDDMAKQLRHFLEGYEQFTMFEPTELHLIEPLRALRMLNYSAWLARRWHDPAFPQAFPWFDSPRYWEDQLLTYREQIEKIGPVPELV